jgi:uncharacterized protein
MYSQRVGLGIPAKALKALKWHCPWSKTYMQLSQDPNHGKFYIRSYSPGEIRVNDQNYYHSIILTPTQIIDDWSPQQINQLKPLDFSVIVQENPEVVLLGTGKQQHFPPTVTMAPLIEHNIGYEVMDTAAACRTYNVLVAEGRKVIAALLIT